MAVVTSRAYGAIEGGTGAGEAVNEAANEAAGEAANAPSRISMLIPMVDMANHDDRKTNTVKVIILQIPVFLHVATPFFFAALISSGIPFERTTGARQLFPNTLITDDEIFLTSGLPFPLIFPLLRPET